MASCGDDDSEESGGSKVPPTVTSTTTTPEPATAPRTAPEATTPAATTTVTARSPDKPAPKTSNTPASPRADVPDACKLLTAAEAATAVGKASERTSMSGTSVDEHAYSQCRWTAEPRDLGVVVIASDARYETHRKLPGGQKVSGLGDKAIIRAGTSLETAGGTGGRTVTVLVGDRTLVVALDRGGTTSKAAVIALARRALKRLD